MRAENYKADKFAVYGNRVDLELMEPNETVINTVSLYVPTDEMAKNLATYCMRLLDCAHYSVWWRWKTPDGWGSSYTKPLIRHKGEGAVHNNRANWVRKAFGRLTVEIKRDAKFGGDLQLRFYPHSEHDFNDLVEILHIALGRVYKVFTCEKRVGVDEWVTIERKAYCDERVARIVNQLSYPAILKAITYLEGLRDDEMVNESADS